MVECNGAEIAMCFLRNVRYFHFHVLVERSIFYSPTIQACSNCNMHVEKFSLLSFSCIGGKVDVFQSHD